VLQSLRGRITFAYLAFVIIIYVVVAGVLARGTVLLYARNANDAIQVAATQIRQFTAAHPDASLAQLSAQVRTVESPALHLVVFEHRPPSAVPPTGPPPGAIRPQTNRFFFAISNIAGIRPDHIDTKTASVFVGANPDRLGAILKSYVLLGLAGLVAVSALGFLIGRYLAAQALAPMLAVTGALERFAEGDFTPQRIDTRNRTEVGELARAFNGAAAQVATAFDERRRVEEYIRQFVADASHELRTPLTVIRGYLDVLRRGALADPEKRERALQTMDMESNRMRALIDKLIVLARLERPQPSEVSPIDVAAVVRGIVESARAVPGNPPLSVDLDDATDVLAEESELHEAIANLVDNARKYGDGAQIHVSVKRSGAFVVVQIADAGPGIEPEDQPHIFDRFYRGESRGEIGGSGLGLAIAAQAVTRAHGTLRLLESRPGRTIFEIKLPATRRSVEASPAPHR
jgi:signal transduction histidine kinase